MSEIEIEEKCKDLKEELYGKNRYTNIRQKMDKQYAKFVTVNQTINQSQLFHQIMNLEKQLYTPEQRKSIPKFLQDKIPQFKA